jgi:hypothetical protein
LELATEADMAGVENDDGRAALIVGGSDDFTPLGALL